MSDGTEIAWTDATWNPLVGCSRVSKGCERCYAERFMHRGLHHKGLTRSTSRGPVWTGEVRLVEKALDLPLRWRKPRRIFVNSLSDLFHESVSDETIDRVFAVTALAPQHTFQVLTKRPERMRAYVSAPGRREAVECAALQGVGLSNRLDPSAWVPWPLRNVWLGISAENQEAFDERVRWLVQMPAALRFVSAEPLLGPLDIDTRRLFSTEEAFAPPPNLGWVICGGESGPGARPCDVSWLRSIVEQCRESHLVPFVKQLGARPYDSAARLGDDECVDSMVARMRDCVRDRKGADPSEWPEDLRVQEMPK
jgi:protein gp37